jgi:hypothetical protein
MRIEMELGRARYIIRTDNIKDQNGQMWGPYYCDAIHSSRTIVVNSQQPRMGRIQTQGIWARDTINASLYFRGELWKSKYSGYCLWRVVWRDFWESAAGSGPRGGSRGQRPGIEMPFNATMELLAGEQRL